MTAFGLYVYADTNYQSPFMLGRGDHMLMGSDWPYNRVPRCLKVYYMMNFSYHLEDLLAHLIHPAQNDFFEMLLHHYITLMLVAGSYMTNVWNSGINAMIQMDNGDFFVGVVKTFIDVIPAVAVHILNLFKYRIRCCQVLPKRPSLCQTRRGLDKGDFYFCQIYIKKNWK